MREKLGTSGKAEQTEWEVSEGETPEILVSMEGVTVEKLNQERRTLQKEFWQRLNDKEKRADFEEYVTTVNELHKQDPEVLLPRIGNYAEEVITSFELSLGVNKKMADAALRGVSQEERAELEGTYDSSRHTVEVQSSRLYDKRREALVTAMEAADLSDEQREKERAVIEATHGLFVTHRDLSDKRKNPQPAGIMEVQQYYTERATAHNNLIRNLNDLNGMCDKYGVTKLTYRNFLTNNPYSAKRISPELNGRQEEDRKIVEQYFAYAFKEHSLDKSFDVFARGGTVSEDDGGKVNLFDDMYLSPEEEEDKEWVRMRQIQHLQRKREEAEKAAREAKEAAKAAREAKEAAKKTVEKPEKT
ncbi:hypothetical protein FWH13_01410 [Candidatus Saccharibacteria bacterium]|nr:hypothetical protein [Candidatus Saccharibacteria bacterium]